MKPVADFSVLMPTYNHARYLRRALDAILAQSVQPREIIIVDDCSTDETPAILAEYVAKFPIVHVLRNARNAGVNASVRRSLAKASSSYVFFAASDDQILPGFIEKSMDVLVRHSHAGLCCSYHSTLDGISGEVRENPSRWCDRPRYFSPGEVEELLASGGIAGHTAVLKREAVEAAGGYRPELEWHADLFLSQVVAFRHGLCHIPESLALLTVMPGTYSASPQKDSRQASVMCALLDLLKSPEHADVAPSFRRSGCLASFGPPLFRAAAARPDVWTPAILSLINCFAFAQYEAWSGDPDQAIRELATFFLSIQRDVRRALGREMKALDTRIREQDAFTANQHRVIVELSERIQVLDSTIEKANHKLAWMKAIRLSKVRAFFARCKRAMVGLFKSSKESS